MAKRKRVLLVEAEPDILRLLRMLFEPGRYVVVSAGDLAAARRVLTELAPPDLFILDPMLPDGNGLDLCREVKATRPALPIVILTTDVKLRDEALAAGADLFFPKPFDPEELQVEASRLLRARSRRQRARS